jgi:hypothetical protein
MALKRIDTSRPVALDAIQRREILFLGSNGSGLKAMHLYPDSVRRKDPISKLTDPVLPKSV